MIFRKKIHPLTRTLNIQTHTRKLLKKAVSIAEQQQELLLETISGLEYIKGCFEAAACEGLYEALEETTDLRLKDLVERRLMYAYYFVKDGSKVE